jgi:hypothetical protein
MSNLFFIIFFFYFFHLSFLHFSFSFLGAMLTSGMKESETDIVEIDSDPILFRFILDYLYGVSIEVPSSLIIPLLGMSSSYSMIGMRDKLSDMLGQHLCIDNCCSILAAAGKWDISCCVYLFIFIIFIVLYFFIYIRY